MTQARRIPPLTLPELTYLLAYRVDDTALYDRKRSCFLVHTAALADLALSGLVEDADGQPRVSPGQHAVDPVLGVLLHRIAGQTRAWSDWCRQGYVTSMDLLETSLESRGAITVSVTPLRHRRRVWLIDPTAASDLQRRIAAVVNNQADDITVLETALALLAVAGTMSHVVSRHQAHMARSHLCALAVTLDDTANAPLSDAIRYVASIMITEPFCRDGS